MKGEIKALEAHFLFKNQPYLPPSDTDLTKLSEQVAKACHKVAQSILQNKLQKEEIVPLIATWKRNLEKISEYIQTLKENIQSVQEFSKEFSQNKNKIKIKGSKKEIHNNIELARKFGEIFASKALMRMKREKRGIPDLRKILRTGFKYNNIPVKIQFKKRNIIKKPNLVLLLDVSGSMLSHLPFLISFFYELSEIYQHIRTYVFVDVPVEVSNYFNEKNSTVRKKGYEEIFNEIIQKPEVHRMAYSDYGCCFQNFKKIAEQTFDTRTVFVVVGDARNNFKYEALREFYEISMRSAQTIWINPENKSSWNSGDSIIEHYASSCDYTLHIDEAEDLVQLFETQLIDPIKKHRRYIVFNDFSQKFKIRFSSYHSYNYYPRYPRYGRYY